MALWFFRKIYKLDAFIVDKHFTYLGYIMLVLAAGYGYFTFSEYLTDWYGSETWTVRLIDKLFSWSEYGPLFLFTSVGGILLPIIVVAVPKLRKPGLITIAAGIMVLAMWVKRYLIIVPTLETPLLPIEDIRPEYVKYSITWVEWALSLSGIAFFLLLFTLATKFMTMIPVSEMATWTAQKNIENVMTAMNIRIFISGLYRYSLGILTVFMLLPGVTALKAQDDQAGKELARSRMSLSANQYPDHSISLEGLLRARVEGVYQKIPGKQVKFYRVDSEGKESLLGGAETTEKGVATLEIRTIGLKPDGEGYLSFVARFAGDDAMTESESDLRLRPAELVVKPVTHDSVYALDLTASAETPEGRQPIADATVSVYVKRMYSSLKVGEGSTDENGHAEVELPNDLPGDQFGNLIITARIDETEDYGNLVATMTQEWGTPVSRKIKELPPALWSPHPPTWMFVTFLILMGTVWGHYIVIMFELGRVKHEGRVKAEHPHSEPAISK